MPTAKKSSASKAAAKYPTAMNLASASLAGAVTLLGPARFPRWARRGLTWANTAGTAGSVFLTVSDRDDLPEGHALHKAISSSDLLAAASGGLMLVTSGIGLKADAKAEKFLTGRGIKHPRLVLAIGVTAVIFAVKTIQDKASKGSDAASDQGGSDKPQDREPITGHDSASDDKTASDEA